MKIKDIIDKIDIGMCITMQMGHKTSMICGKLTRKYTMENKETDEITYWLELQIGDRHVVIDTRYGECEIISVVDIHENNILLKDKMDYYMVNKNAPIMDTLRETLKLWNDYDESGQNDISEIIMSLLNKDNIKTIFQSLTEKKQQVIDVLGIQE